MKESTNYKYIIETCIDTVYSCHQAIKGSANRIELCSALGLGGLTPSASMIAYAQEKLEASIAVMIRPRSGDFLYDDDEFELMKRDIEYCKQIGVDSVVLGLLTASGEVDKERTKRLVETAGDVKVCFHRAIDMTPDILEATQAIVDCGCRRVLTSGGCATAVEGIENIKQMQLEFGNSIDIMVGGGISAANANLFKPLGILNFHLSGKADMESKMLFRKDGISMGATSPEKEYIITQTDARKVAEMRAALESE